MSNELPPWVQVGEAVQVAHYNGDQRLLDTTPAVISYVGGRGIVLVGSTERFTRRHYNNTRDVFERFGSGLSPHRYTLRPVARKDLP